MGRPIYPEQFERLAEKMGRPLHPPGRDVRCIVSVGMLTEGWDCNTVTHIVGLRPFMSQLLCEQVVGRGLRRASYAQREDGRLTEEVAKVFGVPFEVVPFKATQGAKPPSVERHHIHAVPERARYEITYPRVSGYSQAIRNRVTVDWNTIAPLTLDPQRIPPEVEVKAGLPSNQGRPTLSGPGRLERVDLNPFRRGRRRQELAFDLAAALTREYAGQPSCDVPAQALFPQILRIVDRYLREKVRAVAPADLLDVFLAPYYGWVVERLKEDIRPDTTRGEAPEIALYESNRGPGSTAEVDFWTGRDVREVERSHLNFVVADTRRWEQSAAYILDTHPQVAAFAKNSGLGFAIPYVHNGQAHDYVPDFIIRLSADRLRHLILETKGYDPLEDVKRQAAERWVSAVNAEGSYGRWAYRVAKSVGDIAKHVDAVSAGRP
jgi:type III restriction enzyme